MKARSLFRHLISTHAVTWPWDTGFDIVTANDAFETGILIVRVEFAVIDLTDIVAN
jgi:hypothetical protein